MTPPRRRGKALRRRVTHTPSRARSASRGGAGSIDGRRGIDAATSHGSPLDEGSWPKASWGRAGAGPPCYGRHIGPDGASRSEQQDTRVESTLGCCPTPMT